MEEYDQMLKEEEEQRNLGRKNLPYITDYQQEEFDQVNERFKRKIDHGLGDNIDNTVVQAYQGKRNKAALRI